MIKTNLGGDLLADLDEIRARQGVTRIRLIRQAVAQAIADNAAGTLNLPPEDTTGTPGPQGGRPPVLGDDKGPVTLDLQELLPALDALAKKHHATRSHMLRTAIRRLIEAERTQTAKGQP